jgi:hypothetical protein
LWGQKESHRTHPGAGCLNSIEEMRGWISL